MLSLNLDFFKTASILRETTRKESSGTRLVEAGNAFKHNEHSKELLREKRGKNKLLDEMEIVIGIRSKYFALRKGQIIFPFFQMLFSMFKTLFLCLPEL